jgi:general secretion pathway protein G
MNAPCRRARGFTLIEMVITLALVGLLSMAVLPLYDITVTRMKETELRTALRTLRAALDAYKAASDSGVIPSEPGASGYPPNLDVLAQGVDTKPAGSVTLSGQSAAERVVFLRQVPRDPFHPDPKLPAAITWQTRAYGTPPELPQTGSDVFDVSSTITRVGLNGIAYSQW